MKLRAYGAGDRYHRGAFPDEVIAEVFVAPSSKRRLETMKDHYARGWDRVDHALTLDEWTLKSLRSLLP